jgi:hypothetical protein
MRGAVLFLTTGLMGMPGLWSFNWTIRVGGEGCFCVKCLICFLGIIKLHFLSVFVICAWSLLVGLFGSGWTLFSKRKVCIFL